MYDNVVIPTNKTPKAKKQKSRNDRVQTILGVFGVCFRIVCFVGFFIQVIEFLKIYYNYPVRVEIEARFEKSLTAPRVTICNRNRLRKMKMVSEFKNFKWYYGSFSNTSLLESFQKGGFVLTPDAVETLFGHLSSDDILKYGHSQPDSLLSCEPDDMCSHAYNTLHPKFAICFSIGGNISHLSKQLWPRKDYHYIYDLRNIKINHLDYSEAFPSPGIFFKIHDVGVVPNMAKDSQFIPLGTQGGIFIKKIVTELLPYPYKTNCINRVRNESDETSWTKEECLRKCFWTNAEGVCNINGRPLKCKPFLSIVGNFFTETDFRQKCSSGAIKLIRECAKRIVSNISLESCEKECPLDCVSVDYEVEDVFETRAYGNNKTIKIGASAFGENSNETDTNNTFDDEDSIKLYIMYKNTIQVINGWQPIYQTVELCSYLGGFIGIWLGVSVMAIPSYLFEAWSKYSFYRRNRKTFKTTVKSIARRPRLNKFNRTD